MVAWLTSWIGPLRPACMKAVRAAAVAEMIGMVEWEEGVVQGKKAGAGQGAVTDLVTLEIRLKAIGL